MRLLEMVYQIILERWSGKNQLEQDSKITYQLTLDYQQLFLSLLMGDYKSDVKRRQILIRLYKHNYLQTKD
jgi:hypothetical protein